MARLRMGSSGIGRRFGGGLIAMIVVVAVIAAGIAVAVTAGGGKTNHLTAYFSRTVGLYTGNDVRVMGVKVGHIDSITPVGTQVKVEMSYDATKKVPADAKAVVIVPSVVSDRYIQLTPGYTSGPTLPDHAVLGCPPDTPESSSATCAKETAVPLELDEIFDNIDALNKALGPRGANSHGALSRLVKIGAANLKGNGKAFNGAFREFADAISTLAGSKGNLFDTVRSLQRFTTAIANDDGGVRALNSNLAKVGTQLAGERKDLGAALENLSSALTAVQSFVANNRAGLTHDIHGLAKVTNVLTQEKEALTQFTDTAPLALSNLGLAYDPVAHTLDTKADLTEPLNKLGPSGALCQLLSTLGLTSVLGTIASCQDPQQVTTGNTTSHTPPTLAELLRGDL